MAASKATNFLTTALLCKTVKDVIVKVNRKNESALDMQLLEANGNLDKIVINNVSKHCSTVKNQAE